MDATTVQSQWQLQLLPQLRAEMEQMGMLSPLLWVPVDSVADICYEKLVDMLYFAPTDWDTLMGSLACIVRNVFMSKLSYDASFKSLRSCRDFMSGTREPLVLRYWKPLKHLVDCTWVLLTCLYRGRSVADVVPGVLGGIVATSSMTLVEQSVLAASKSVTLQLCHYAQWPSLLDERGPLFLGATQAAGLAMKLHPGEGVWITLYARCLSWRHPEKAVMLQNAVRLARTPFTMVELAMLYARSSNSQAVVLAAKLITCAVQEWTGNIYVNTSYVTMLLNSNCRSLLSLETAQECLQRAKKLAPDSPLLSGYYWNLLDVERAGGPLSPILEEGDEEVIAQGLRWNAEAEATLRSIAAKLYPGVPVGAVSAPKETCAPLFAAPEKQPTATGVDKEEDDGPRPRQLWSPSPTGRAVRKSATPSPPPTSSRPPSSMAISGTTPSTSRSPPPASPTISPTTPSTSRSSPLSSMAISPTTPSKSRSPPLSSMTVSPTTPSTSRSTSPSTSPPSGRRLRTHLDVPVLRMPHQKASASSSIQSSSMSSPPKTADTASDLPLTSCSEEGPEAHPAATASDLPLTSCSEEGPEAHPAATQQNCTAAVFSATPAQSRLYRVCIPAPPPPFGRSAAHSPAAPSPAAPSPAAPSPAAPSPAAPSPAAPSPAAHSPAAHSPAAPSPAALGSSSITKLKKPLVTPWAANILSSTTSPLTPPPTPSPPREGLLNNGMRAMKREQEIYVPLWRRSDGAGQVEKQSPLYSWRKSPPASVASKDTAPEPSKDTAPVAVKPTPVVNCVCSGSCVMLTFRHFRTLRPDRSIPKLCSLKVK